MILFKNKLSPIAEDYYQSKKELKDLYSFTPNHLGILEAANHRSFENEKRNTLKKVLRDQYQNIDASEATLLNIDKLDQTNTFTITTGHQLCLMTGPLFSIYKIASTIKLAKDLSHKYPDKHFVPVFWMASEDHDFEEINHFYLFGKKYEWKQSLGGAVGELPVSDLAEILGETPENIDQLIDFYREGTLSKSTFELVNHLFKKYGLVIIEPNQKELKQLMKPYFEKEITNQISNEAIEGTNQGINDLGYNPQLHSRKINLFYLEEHNRNRIIIEENQYKINNTSLTFSQEEIITELNNHPEKFSPNAALRPLYQEVILPNIAYIGGPGELSYWLQLKSTFDKFDVDFPALIHRDSFLILDKMLNKQLEKFGGHPFDLFKDVKALKVETVERLKEQPFDIEDEHERITKAFKDIISKIEDKSLHPAVEASLQKLNKDLLNLEKRVQKSEERKNEGVMNAIEKAKDRAFPEGIPQERHDNFLNFQLNYPNFIDLIINHCNVMERGIKIINLEEV